ncbi:MAG: HAMP domain-containing sensor histidine kinase [Rhodanobacteraceae bacterium]
MRSVSGYRRRLRSRIFISYFLFGLALVAAFATATVYLRARLEAQLIGNTLLTNLNQNANTYYENPKDLRFRLEKIDGYVIARRNFDKTPDAWKGLENGVHDVVETKPDGTTESYKLAVRKDPDFWFFLKYDTSQEQRSQTRLQYALIGAVAVFALLSLLIGAWLSTRVIRPVTDLAQRLRGFREGGRVTPLAPHFASDEVGELAEALDEYAERLTHVVERDREFNSDVSHELRTPLAVIASTTELLQSSPDLTDKLRERLKRIERSSRQATELIEALLLLSRAERSGPMDGENSDVARVVKDVVASQKPQLRGKPVEIHIEASESLAVNAPSSVLAVALTNLIGNAIKYTQRGEVRIHIGDGKVVVTDTGQGIGDEDVQRLFQRGVRGKGVSGSGAGLGLAIVIRLCDLYGWQVSLAPRQDTHGTIATLDFVLPPQAG